MDFYPHEWRYAVIPPAKVAARGAERRRKPQKAAGGRQEAAQDAPESPSTTKVKLHAGMVFSDLSSDGYGNAPRLNISVIMHTIKNANPAVAVQLFKLFT